MDLKERQNLIEQMSIWVNAQTLSKHAIAVSCADVAERYHKEQLRLNGVVRQSEQLKDGHKNSFKYWLEENNYKKVYDKYVKWGFEYSESDLLYKYNEEVMNL